jgi:hypothetical protein
LGVELEALLFLAASGLCGWFGGRALAPAGGRAVRALSYLLAGLLALVLPVQVSGTLEIAGFADHTSLLSAAVVALGVALLAWWSTRHRNLAADESRLGGLRSSMWLLAALIIVASAYGILAVRLFVLYPTGWDALSYHFPLSARWLQEGTMRIPTSRAWQFSLPGNAEIAFMIFMATGKQSLIPVANWPAVLILALSVYVIALKLGSSRKAAVSAALITLSIPIVHHQSFSGYVDLFGTAGLLASLALFLCRHRSDGLVDHRVVFAAALACGLCIGTKPTFFVYGPVFFAATMFGLMREPNRSGRSAVSWMTLLSVGILIPSVFWFWRAALETGNPVFPLEVRLGKTVLLPGYAPTDITALDHEYYFVRAKWEWLIYPWTEWKKGVSSSDYLHLVYGSDSGLGAAFATFVTLGLALAVWQFARQVRRQGSPRTIILAVWTLLLFVWCVAMRRMPRFGLPVWSLACALSGPMLSLTWRYRPVWTGALLSTTIAATTLVSSCGPLYELAASLYLKRFSRAEVYRYAKFIDRLPPGSRVVNRTGPFNFLLFGEHLTNRVIPNFEQPLVLTRAFLDGVRADYVVEAAPAGQPALAPADGLTLVAEESLGKANEEEVWRLWAVGKSNPAGKMDIPPVQ